MVTLLESFEPPLVKRGVENVWKWTFSWKDVNLNRRKRFRRGEVRKSRYRNKRWVSESQYNFSVRYIYVPEYICRFLQHASNQTSEFDITSLVGMNTAVIGLYRHSGFCNQKVFWNTYYNCLMKYIINTYRLYLGEQNDSILAQY